MARVLHVLPARLHPAAGVSLVEDVHSHPGVAVLATAVPVDSLGSIGAALVEPRRGLSDCTGTGKNAALRLGTGAV